MSDERVSGMGGRRHAYLLCFERVGLPLGLSDVEMTNDFLLWPHLRMRWYGRETSTMAVSCKA